MKEKEQQIQQIKIDKINISGNYRKSSGKESMAELTASIKAKGILMPLLVRPDKKKGVFKLIAGSRRLQAAKAAGLKEVPVISRVADDVEALELSVIENTQREDPDLMDEADGFEKLIKLGKHTAYTLALKTGKSLKYVGTRLRLAVLPADVRKGIRKKMDSGEIGIGHALLVTRLKNPADMERFVDQLDDTDTVEDARGSLGEYSTEMSMAPFDVSACETCPARTNNQAQLFPEIEDENECMDQACFRGKSFDFYKTHYAKLEDEGFKVVRDEKEYLKVRAGKNAREIDLEGWDTPKRYKTMCLKCKEHHVYCLIIKKDNMGEKQAVREEICLDVKCYNKMNGRVQSAVSGNGASSLPRDNSHTKRVHANVVRDRFLHTELPSKVKASTAVTQRLAIYHLLDGHDFITEQNEAGFETLIKENCKELKKGLYQAILSIPENKLMDVLTEAVLLNIPKTDSQILLQAAPEAGIDMDRDFRMDDIYLASNTKAELLDMAKSLKLKGPEASMKKTGMISAILGQNDLTGKLTKDIKESVKIMATHDLMIK